MNDTVVSVENLGKRYRIGVQEAEPTSLREAIGSFVGSTFRYLRQMRRPPTDEETLWALREVSFEVKRGEVLGIIGRNGAGKSTMLKILSRITEPTEGRVIIDGRVGSLLEVGTGFHPELTGRENIYLNGAILGMKKREIDRKFDEIVEFSEIEKFLDTPVKRYSSGMYVRLAFGVAAHLEPETLIVDEVLAVGDAAFQRKCLGKIQDVSKSGRTILFVSHNMAAVEGICDRVLWLDSGRLIADGASAGIIAAYVSTSFSARTEQFWENPDQAPGNRKVRLRRINIRPAHGQPLDSITVLTPLVVEVEFWNLLPATQLDVDLRLTTEHGVVAFDTNTGHSLGWDRTPTATGLHKATCQIPGNLLNTGVYRIMVRLARKRSEVIFLLEDALIFEVREVPEVGGHWPGKPTGAVRPLLKWTLEPMASTPDEVIQSQSMLSRV